MPNYKNKHSKKIKVYTLVSSDLLKETLSNVSNIKLKGYIKRRVDKLSAQRSVSEKYSEYSKKGRKKNQLRDAADPKPVKEMLGDLWKKVLLFFKTHKSPKDKRAARHIKPKYLLLIFAVICIALIVLSGINENFRKPFKDIASIFVVPAQKGVNSIGLWLSDLIETNKSIDELKEENRKLRSELDELTLQMSAKKQQDSELARLYELLDLKDTY